VARYPTSTIHRCPGRLCRHRPILGVWNQDGSLSIRKDSLKLHIETGDIMLGCRECGHEQAFSVPLVASTASILLSA